MKLLSITNITARRHLELARACQAVGVSLAIVSWRQILEGDWDRKLLTWADLIRIDSPGKNARVELGLLQAGAGLPDPLDPLARFWRLSLEELARETWEIGRIPPLRQWQLGFSSVIMNLASEFTANARLTSPVTDILCCFDKESTTQRLLAAGCPVVRSLGVPSSAEAALDALREAGIRRFFLKSCHGSSASGMTAVEMSPLGLRAYTTVKMPRMVNSRKIIQLDGISEVKPLLDGICRLRAQLQPWVPKAGWHGHRVDFRVVTIAGKVTHVVPRLSQTPFTTLQLGAKRGDFDVWRKDAGKNAWDILRDTAEQAARVFSESLCLGIDILMTTGWRKAYVIEVNAFGDLLPGVMDIAGNGSDTYAIQLAEMQLRC